MKMTQMLKKIKLFIGIFVRVIQKVIIFISLFLLYLIGFGIVAIFLKIFNRKRLMQDDKVDSFWIAAKGYEENLEKSLRQS